MKVITYKNLPKKLPLSYSITAYLFLDHFNTPEWVWAATSFFLVILWFYCIASIIKQDEINMFSSSKK